MIKIRNGIFETNSSSTHVCVIGASNIIDEWSKEIYIYAPSFNKYLKDLIDENPDKYLEGDFVKTEVLEKIPLNKLFELKETYFIPEGSYPECSSKYNLKNLWDLLCENEDSADISPDILEDENMENILKYISNSSREYEEDVNYFWPLKELFESLGDFMSYYTMTISEGLEVDFNHANVNGQEVTVVCGYGYN